MIHRVPTEADKTAAEHAFQQVLAGAARPVLGRRRNIHAVRTPCPCHSLCLCLTLPWPIGSAGMANYTWMSTAAWRPNRQVPDLFHLDTIQQLRLQLLSFTNINPKNQRIFFQGEEVPSGEWDPPRACCPPRLL